MLGQVGCISTGALAQSSVIQCANLDSIVSHVAWVCEFKCWSLSHDVKKPDSSS